MLWSLLCHGETQVLIGQQRRAARPPFSQFSRYRCSRAKLSRVEFISASDWGLQIFGAYSRSWIKDYAGKKE